MTTAVALEHVDGKPGEVYLPLKHITLPAPNPGPNDVVIRMSAASLNHRDIWIRQKQYMGATHDVTLLADGCGVVVEAGDSPTAQAWLRKRVVLCPGQGWKSDPQGPEDLNYAILGGTKGTPLGTLAQTVVVDAGELEEAPKHLSNVEAAALPLVGLTAWRALYTKTGNAQRGRNILITGIGGGVALQALSFAVSEGCNVYVTSGSDEKLAKAKELGAKGGVIYKNEKWEKELLAMLPEERPKLDAIIDSAGGDIVAKGVKLLKLGGVIVTYGMTTAPQVAFPMTAVLANIELRGSTMGSRMEFGDMMEAVRQKKIKPIVSGVVHGIDDLSKIDGLFDDMKNGTQFGKLVVEIANDSDLSRL